MKKQFLPLLFALVLVGCGKNDNPTTTEPTTEGPKSYYISSASDIVGGSITFSSVEAVAGTTISVYATANEGYSFVSFSSNVNSVTFSQVDTTENIEYTFVMPTSDITIDAEFSLNNYSISASSISNGNITFSATQASVGTSVVVDVTANKGYELKTIGSEVEGVVLSPVTVGSKYKFNMPGRDVVIDATFEKISYDVIVASSIKGGSITVSHSKANVGDKVTVTYAADAGYKFDEITTNVDDLSLTEGDNNTYSFTMPAADVVVDASFSSKIFTVKTVEVEGGYLFVSTTKTILGDKVIVDVVTESGYKFDGITADDDNLEIKEIEENKSYSFIMPENNVTLTPKFVASVKVSSIKTDTSTGNLMFSISEGDEFYKGDKEKIIISNYYSLAYDCERLYVHINDKVYRPKLDENDDKKAIVDFEVPNTNLDITIVSSSNTESETGYSIKFEHDEYVSIYGYEVDKKYSYLSAKIFIKHGYLVNSVKYLEEGSDTWVDDSISFYNDVATFSIHGFSKNRTYKIEGEMVGEKRISYANLDQVNISSYGSSEPIESVMPGTDVSMRVTAKDSGSYIKSIKVYGIQGTNELVLSAADYINFKMPSNDIIIVFETSTCGKLIVEECEAIKESIASLNSYSLSPITGAAPGKSFYLLFNVNDGFYVKGIKINGENSSVSINSSYSNYSYQVNLTMPADGSDMNISFDYAVTHKVEIDSAMDVTNGTISINSGTSYAAGQEVNISINPKTGFDEIDEISVVGHDDVEVTIIDPRRSAKFVMPDYDVKLTATFKKAETSSVTVNELTATAQEGLKSFSIQGWRSNSSLSAAGTETFIKGETINFSVTTKSGYVAKIIIKDNGNEETINSTYGNKTEDSTQYSFDTYSIEGSNVEITISVEVLAPLNVTIENEYGITLSYKVNEATVSTLENALYVGDFLSVSTSDNAENGYYYAIEVSYTNDAETELTKDYYGNYTINDDITIKVVKKAGYTFAINCEDGMYCYGSLNINGETEYLGSSTSLIIDAESTLGSSYICAYSSAKIVITMGNQELVNRNCESYEYVYFIQENTVITGNIVITITRA